jgi:hypothetical protein
LVGSDAGAAARRPPTLVVALTFGSSRGSSGPAASPRSSSPRIGIETARLIAAGGRCGRRRGRFRPPLGRYRGRLREAGPRLAFSDASERFAAPRATADPAEIMLTARASSIAASALSRIDPRAPGIGAIVAAVEGEARRFGAEEVYVAAATDLARDRRLVRIETTHSGEPALGARCGARVSPQGRLRRVVTIDRDGMQGARRRGGRTAGPWPGC